MLVFTSGFKGSCTCKMFCIIRTSVMCSLPFNSVGFLAFSPKAQGELPETSIDCWYLQQQRQVGVCPSSGREAAPWRRFWSDELCCGVPGRLRRPESSVKPRPSSSIRYKELRLKHKTIISFFSPPASAPEHGWLPPNGELNQGGCV